MAAYFFDGWKEGGKMLMHYTLQKLRKEKEAKEKQKQNKQQEKSDATDEKPVEKKSTSRRKAKA